MAGFSPFKGLVALALGAMVVAGCSSDSPTTPDASTGGSDAASDPVSSAPATGGPATSGGESTSTDASGSPATNAPATTGSGSASAAAGIAEGALFDALPEDIQQAGAIVVGSSIDYPPFEYFDEDGETPIGFEVELADELERYLGVEFEWNHGSFDSLFTGLRSDRYDIVYGATNDTPEREETFDFVNYMQSSQGFVVAAGNPQGITDLADICGKSIAAVRAGIQAQYLEAQSQVCVEEGNDPIEVLTFDGNSGEQLAVKNGQAAAMLENYPTAAVFARDSNGELELVPDLQVERRYFGMVVPKDKPELRDALQQAWQAIIDDGSYAQVLQDWGLADIGIDTALINGTTTTPLE